VTREEAVAQIALEVPELPPSAVDEILATFDEDMRETPPGTRTEMLLRSYARDGQCPGQTGWQVFGQIVAQVPEWAAKAAPIVSIALALLPLL
jgi:hypothetical protein